MSCKRIIIIIGISKDVKLVLFKRKSSKSWIILCCFPTKNYIVTGIIIGTVEDTLVSQLHKMLLVHVVSLHFHWILCKKYCGILPHRIRQKLVSSQDPCDILISTLL